MYFDKTALQKGRGAQSNPTNRFENLVYESDVDIMDSSDKIQLIKTQAKTIINKVNSPDIPFQYSMNPYQGCEHGCIYCYARDTHPYWGYSAGLDFERKIVVKKNANALLIKKLRSKNWKAAPILLSGNTDCYQPIERKLEITRSLLKTLNRFNHPAVIITKNSLVLRDFDVIKTMADKNLIRLVFSITSLTEETRQILEPRTSSIKKRLETLQKFAEADIPITVLIGPVIPGINDHEIVALVKRCALLGADDINYITVRLNGEVGQIFEDWIYKALPERADKVMNKIKSLHGGKINDSRTGTRMRGEGKISAILKDQFRIAKQKYFGATKKRAPLDCDLYYKTKDPQLKLF